MPFSLGFIAILCLLVILAIPVAIIYLLVSNSDLKRRIAALETGASASATPRVDTAIPAKVSTPAAAQDPVKAAPQTPVSPPQDIVAAATPQTAGAPKAFVFTGEKIRTLVAWITQNWFYAVSAISLALAGIFLVIYGMEQGLLPPIVRVMASIVFGGALVGAGEFIRRRYGDSENTSTAYLPSTFSGAGIVTLFGAVLSARLFYDFIGPEIALIGMVSVAVLAVLLGWFYGPLLAAVGIVGAMISPFIIGGSSEDPSILLVYFLLIALAGLGIDTMRRWAWISVISLTLGFAAGFLLMLGSSAIVQPYFVIYCVALTIAAIAIPVRKRVPDHDGPLLSQAIFGRLKGDPWPEFPTRLAGGAIAAASGLILVTALESSKEDVFWIAVFGLAGLTLALLIWARNAAALLDLTILPAASLVAVIPSGTVIWYGLKEAAMVPEADMPLMASILVAIGLVVSGTAAWRSLREGRYQVLIALGAALFAPVIAIALEVFWQPAQILGGYAWALHAMLIAAVMVVIAERFARVDGPQERDRASFAILSALASIAFGAVILFSTAALTAAIAVTVVAAAWLDRQFKLPLMGLYILVGIVAIGFRLVADPGLGWALEAPLWEVLLSHAGAVVAFVISYLLVKAAKRPIAEGLLESAVFSSTGVLISVLLWRAILALNVDSTEFSHWSLGLGATIWIVLGLAQLRRLEMGGPLIVLRKFLTGLFLLIGAVHILGVLTAMNPLVSGYKNLVLGPSFVNTLIPAYILPAVALALGVRWLTSLSSRAKIAALSTSGILIAMWIGLTIRHFWRGAEGLELPGIDQPELYSYTVVLLVIGAGLFYQSLAKSNATLRKAGLIVIGLAVAKVFVLDIQGLGGLIRVFSLLFLGLALAGLAWLNRWAQTRNGETEIAES